MREALLKPGARVYHLETGQLYRLTKAVPRDSATPPDVRWACVLLGRRGEETLAEDIYLWRLLDDFALWCERCNGTGQVDVSGSGWYGQSPCPDCQAGMVP